MYRHPKWKHLGQIENYALCIVDKRNYGIYDTTKKYGYKHSIGYYGKLKHALRGLLERLVKDKASQTTISEITYIVSVVEDVADRIAKFGQELDAKFSREMLLHT